MGALRGNLPKNQLPDVIQSLGRDRESGVLQVTRDDVSKRIYFGRGSMVFARSTLHSDRLGEMLVRKGDLTRSNLALASNKMRLGREKLGTTLVSLGLFTKHQVQARLEEQVRTIIHSLFTWSEGAFRFQQESSPVEPDVNDMKLDLPAVPIILEGTRFMEPAAVRSALHDVSRVVSYTKDPRVIAHYGNLTPEEEVVLSRVDGTATLSDIVSMSPLAEVETLRCLYSLLASGFLDVGKKSREVAPSAEKRQDRKAFRPLIKKYHPDRHRQEVVKAKPPTPSENMAERYYREAKEYFAERDFREVVKLMEEAVGIDPSNVRYQRLLLEALSRNPKWQENAEEHFKKALGLDPFDTESLIGLAELYQAVGLARGAQALYADAVQIDPGNAILRMKSTLD